MDKNLQSVSIEKKVLSVNILMELSPLTVPPKWNGCTTIKKASFYFISINLKNVKVF